MAVCIDRLLRSPCAKAPRPIHFVHVPPWHTHTLAHSHTHKTRLWKMSASHARTWDLVSARESERGRERERERGKGRGRVRVREREREKGRGRVESAARAVGKEKIQTRQMRASPVPRAP